jgi:hypothetical protein
MINSAGIRGQLQQRIQQVVLPWISMPSEGLVPQPCFRMPAGAVSPGAVRSISGCRSEIPGANVVVQRMQAVWRAP